MIVFSFCLVQGTRQKEKEQKWALSGLLERDMSSYVNE